jgi:hypothetical protein
MDRRQWLMTLVGIALSPSVKLIQKDDLPPLHLGDFVINKKFRTGYYGWGEMGYAVLDNRRLVNKGTI